MATLIRNAQVWDGTGSAPFGADVLIEGEKIAAVGVDLQAMIAVRQWLLPG